jgi:hypothetical protein
MIAFAIHRCHHRRLQKAAKVEVPATFAKAHALSVPLLQNYLWAWTLLHDRSMNPLRCELRRRMKQRQSIALRHRDLDR